MVPMVVVALNPVFNLELDPSGRSRRFREVWIQGEGEVCLAFRCWHVRLLSGHCMLYLLFGTFFWLYRLFKLQELIMQWLDQSIPSAMGQRQATNFKYVVVKVKIGRVVVSLRRKRNIKTLVYKRRARLRTWDIQQRKRKKQGGKNNGGQQLLGKKS